MKVLITGFDPFGGESIKPALEAVKKLPNTISNAEIIKLQIPTVFKKSLEKIEDNILAHKPDIVISIGQAGGRFGITPERVAINIDDMEGFISSDNPNNEYNKILLEVEHLNTKTKENCYVYFYNKDIDSIFSEKSVHIPDSDWKNYMINTNKGAVALAD